MKPQNAICRLGIAKTLSFFIGLAFFITSCKKDGDVTAANSTPAISVSGYSANDLAAHHKTSTGTGTTTTTTTTSTTAGSTTTNYLTSAAINLTGSHDITISGKSISGGSVPAITLTNCYNVHITQNLLGNSTDVGIYLYNCYNITVDYNNILNVSTGVYAVNTTGGGIAVNYNQFKNMNGPLPRGQFVQFNTVSGANNSISYNKGENILGSSYPEDAINLYMSNGTSASPIQVAGNWIRGGGPSTTGGGIMLGDNGGSYEVASNNILVNPGQYGMAIAGGDHISITNNQIFAAQQTFTNVGVYIWGQSGSICTNSTISGNQVNFTNSQGLENNAWIGTGETTPAGWSTNVWPASISASILPTTILSF